MGIDNHLSAGYVDAYFRKDWLKVWVSSRSLHLLAITDITTLWLLAGRQRKKGHFISPPLTRIKVTRS